MSQQALVQVLRQLPLVRNRNLLVGIDKGDDAGVYQIGRDRALVQTTDFFMPIVDDPYAYGQVAAANALSDIYAMGGRPLTALNILGYPEKEVSAQTVNRILRGGAAKLKEANCVLVGGHSIRNPEPVYGLAATGMVSPRRMMTNAKARPGDLLVLTKPLGTGILTTGIKRGMVPSPRERRAIRIMAALNEAGAELAERGLLRAAVDITGFGLIGHLEMMCRASRVGAEIEADHVPVLDEGIFDLIAAGCVPGGSSNNLQFAEKFTDWGDTPEPRRILLTDAQTSGGLLLSVPPGNLAKTLRILESRRTPCFAVIGKIVHDRKSRIKVS